MTNEEKLAKALRELIQASKYPAHDGEEAVVAIDLFEASVQDAEILLEDLGYGQ